MAENSCSLPPLSLSQVEGPSCKLPKLWEAAKKEVYPTLKDSERLEILKALSVPNDAVQSTINGPSVTIYTYKVDSGSVAVSYASNSKSYIVSIARTVGDNASQLVVKFNQEGKPILQIESPRPGELKMTELPEERILSEFDQLLQKLESKSKKRNLA